MAEQINIIDESIFGTFYQMPRLGRKSTQPVDFTRVLGLFVLVASGSALAVFGMMFLKSGKISNLSLPSFSIPKINLASIKLIDINKQSSNSPVIVEQSVTQDQDQPDQGGEVINIKVDNVSGDGAVIPESQDLSLSAQIPVEADTVQAATNTVADSNIAISTSSVEASSSLVIPENITEREKKNWLDSDNDGLSDQEEDVLNTNKNNSDSDGDGTSDKEEFLALSNPAGNGELIDNVKIKKYENGVPKYSLLYPSTWQFGQQEANTVVFTSEDGNKIQVLSMPNSKKQSIDVWFNSEVSAKPVSDKQRVSKNGWSGIISENGMNVYVANQSQDKIFIISYKSFASDENIYINIFTVLLNSLIIE